MSGRRSKPLLVCAAAVAVGGKGGGVFISAVSKVITFTNDTVTANSHGLTPGLAAVLGVRGTGMGQGSN